MSLWLKFALGERSCEVSQSEMACAVAFARNADGFVMPWTFDAMPRAKQIHERKLVDPVEPDMGRVMDDKLA